MCYLNTFEIKNVEAKADTANQSIKKDTASLIKKKEVNSVEANNVDFKVFLINVNMVNTILSNFGFLFLIRICYLLSLHFFDLKLILWYN